MPEDSDMNGKIISDLRRSQYVPRQRCQIMNTKLHIENIEEQKNKLIFEKKKECGIVKSKTEFLLESNLEAESKINSILENKPKFLEKYLKISNGKLKITNLKTTPTCTIDPKFD